MGYMVRRNEITRDEAIRLFNADKIEEKPSPDFDNFFASLF